MATNVFKINASAMRIPVVTSDPVSPENGMMWYNSTTNVFKKYEGGATTTIGSGSFTDATFRIQDDGDNTKEIAFQASGITTATTRTITMPDTDVNLGDIATNASAISGNTSDIADLRTTQGTADGATDLGTFTGTTIADASSVKSALQALETSVETKALDSEVIKKDGSVAFTAAQSMGGFKLTNLGTPTADSDAATKVYVDAIKQGLDTKDSVRAISLANISLAVAADPGAVDGVTLANGDRILLAGQTAGAENGIYDAVTAADPTTWIRSADADTSAEVTAGMYMWVEEGTTYGDTGWILSTNDPITLDTTALTFVQFSGAGQITAGSGLTKTGNSLDVNVDGSTIEIVTDTLQVKDAGITDAKIATGIDAAKLADGSVSNTELQYINSLTSNAQDQINGKIGAVSEDATPSLGGDLTVGDNVLLSANGQREGTSAANFYVTQYLHAETLTASSTNTVLTDLTFAHGTYEALIVEYKIKEATTNRLRVGTLLITSNGTDLAITDQFTETADCGVTWDVVINATNTEVRYTTTANNKTMRCTVKKILA